MFVERSRAARELVRVCKPGGRVLATEFYWRKPPTPEARQLFLGEVCPGLQFDSVDDWVDLYTSAGLVNVQVDNGPTIFAIAVSQGLTVRSARVNWTTDVLADSQVDFGPTVGYGSSTPIDPRVGWSHEAQLTGLAPGTMYHFRVRSRDANGALAVSQDATFATAEP